MPTQLLKTKSIDDLVEETHHESKRLKRSLGPWSLIAFGIGAVIGGGIFTVTGTAAGRAAARLDGRSRNAVPGYQGPPLAVRRRRQAGRTRRPR